LQTELKEILPDERGKCRAIVTTNGEEITCGFVGITVGVSPNIGFLKGTTLKTNRGILVNEYLETSEPDVYAIGDCAEMLQPSPGRRPIEAIWYTGRIMGKVVAQNIAGKPVKYDPGIWFNSAKFLDIEYQVYGDVRATLPDNHSSIYWEHASSKKSIRLNYNNTTGAIAGFNLMGIRYRHEVCEKWLQNKTPVEEVLQNLGLANFDPEFFEEYESHLIQRYNQSTGKQLKLKQKRGLPAVLRFLQTH
jgi:NAD(P)H-nitrite reductase large subunit